MELVKADPIVVEQLTAQEWYIVVGALEILAYDAAGSDRKVVKALSNRLAKYQNVSGDDRVTLCFGRGDR